MWYRCDKREDDLLESPTRADEKEAKPLPKLIARETVDSHVGEIAPEDTSGNLPDQRNSSNAASNKYRL